MCILNLKSRCAETDSLSNVYLICVLCTLFFWLSQGGGGERTPLLPFRGTLVHVSVFMARVLVQSLP